MTTDPLTLAARLEAVAEDDVLGMVRDVSLRRNQFVDERDLRWWAESIREAAAAICRLVLALERIAAHDGARFDMGGETLEWKASPQEIAAAALRGEEP